MSKSTSTHERQRREPESKDRGTDLPISFHAGVLETIHEWAPQFGYTAEDLLKVSEVSIRRRHQEASSQDCFGHAPDYVGQVVMYTLRIGRSVGITYTIEPEGILIRGFEKFHVKDHDNDPSAFYYEPEWLIAPNHG